jgi:hypothetical protein
MEGESAEYLSCIVLLPDLYPLHGTICASRRTAALALVGVDSHLRLATTALDFTVRKSSTPESHEYSHNARSKPNVSEAGGPGICQRLSSARLIVEVRHPPFSPTEDACFRRSQSWRSTLGVHQKHYTRDKDASSDQNLQCGTNRSKWRQPGRLWILQYLGNPRGSRAEC